MSQPKLINQSVIELINNRRPPASQLRPRRRYVIGRPPAPGMRTDCAESLMHRHDICHPPFQFRPSHGSGLKPGTGPHQSRLAFPFPMDTADRLASTDTGDAMSSRSSWRFSHRQRSKVGRCQFARERAMHRPPCIPPAGTAPSQGRFCRALTAESGQCFPPQQKSLHPSTRPRTANEPTL